MSDSKIYSIPESVKQKSGQEYLAEGVRQLFNRIEEEKEDLSTQELVLDKSNKIAFPGFPYVFESCSKKIIVSIDVFKSGYECRICKGKKRHEIKCNCEASGCPGMRYSQEQIEIISKTLGESIGSNRASEICPECKGDYVSMRRIETCLECKGRGAILVLPETSKNLPTTGVVLSIGTLVKMREDGKTKYGYGIGDRVLFGPYSGSMVPTKAGLLFKILDASAIWAVVEGANDLGQFDFVLQEAE